MASHNDDMDNSNTQAPTGASGSNSQAPGGNAHDHAMNGAPADALPNIGQGFFDGDFDGTNLLGALADDVFSADRVFSGHLQTLNNSGVAGDVMVLQDGDTVKVLVAADGLEANVHAMHIHGLPDGAESTIPTLAQDTDGDGFVEVAEGGATYGPIILNLTTNPDAALDVPVGALRADLAFPSVGEDGTLFYAQTFNFASDEEAGQFADEIAGALDPLESRHIVIHGQSVEGDVGAGTAGEIDGTPGYKLVLPVANAELEEATTGFEKLVALANLVDDVQPQNADFAFMA